MTQFCYFVSYFLFYVLPLSSYLEFWQNETVFLSVPLLYLSTPTDWPWDSRIWRPSHAIKRYLRMSHILQIYYYTSYIKQEEWSFLVLSAHAWCSGHPNKRIQGSCGRFRSPQFLQRGLEREPRHAKTRLIKLVQSWKNGKKIENNAWRLVLSFSFLMS